MHELPSRETSVPCGTFSDPLGGSPAAQWGSASEVIAPTATRWHSDPVLKAWLAPTLEPLYLKCTDHFWCQIKGELLADFKTRLPVKV